MNDKLTIPEVIPLIKTYKAIDGNYMGGSLHVVLDDGNIDDKSLKWCQNHARMVNDKEGFKLSKILLNLSKTQRKKLANIFYSL